MKTLIAYIISNRWLFNRLYILLVLTWLCVDNTCVAQSMAQYNMNIHNGLPSDNVYCTLRDRHGYLWIGTDKGVVMYNGYRQDIFNEQTGLPDPDVWDFFEDTKGRIWLSRISDEFGYIFNGQYHKVYCKGKSPPFLYPRYITEVDSELVFLSGYKNLIYLCTVANDTLQCNILAKYSKEGSFFISRAGKVYNFESGVLYQLDTHKPVSGFVEKCRFDKYRNAKMIGNHIVTFPENSTGNIVIIYADSCKEQSLALNIHTPVYNQYSNRTKNYIITDSNVQLFDSNMLHLANRKLTQYLSETQVDNNRVAYVIEDSLWGNCIATIKKGCFLSFDIPHFKKVARAEFSKYHYIGALKDGANYWWNNEYRQLAIVHPDLSIVYKRINKLEKVEYITDYDSERAIVFTDPEIVLMDKIQNKVTSLYNNFSYSKINDHNDTTYSELVYTGGNDYNPILGALFGLQDDNGVLHCLSRGRGYHTVKKLGDTVVSDVYNIERYSNIIYMPILKKHILYGADIISIGLNDSQVHIGKDVLSALGIVSIESIITDSVYGNILIKDRDNLLLFNYATRKVTRLNKGHLLKQAQVCLNGNVLIVASKSGVSFSKIYGLGKISKPVFFPNVKALAYKNLYDIAVTEKEVLLNTDSGLLALEIPTEPIYSGAASHTKFKLLLKSSLGLHNIWQGDTIVLKPDESSVIFDVINPMGVGASHIETYIKEIDSSARQLRSEELQLQNIKAGRYYHMLIKVSDDIWSSPSINVVVYRQLTYWQTTNGRFLFWTFILSSILILIFLIVYYTGKKISAAHIRKNYLQGLELRAIYAQINPHFIFNTLNTGLYFISENKNKDAYAHISSFSQLLRSYIKSSRNTYVTLEEEIDNIKHYIKLQKNRFEDKFDFTLELDDTINTHDTVIPSLLLQPFIENAINHGLLHKKEKGHLWIKFFSKMPEKEIICIIEDDGIGRKLSHQINQTNPNKPKSYGNTLIADLVDLINTGGNLHLDINYIDKSGTYTGTIVMITIRKLNHDTPI